MKKFFSKIFNYIKNTAWIQPLLIIVVIFLVLFSLGPIARGISSAWASITSTNKMTKISYDEYLELVYDSKENGTDDNKDQFIVVFTRDGCTACEAIRPHLNKYISANKSVKIYNVDLTLKSDGETFKDNTIGKIEDLYDLDDRIKEYAESGNDVGIEPYTPDQIADGTSPYYYIQTPLIMWYENGIEVKINIGKSFGDNEYVAFKEYISFPEEDDQANWDVAFDL